MEDIKGRDERIEEEALAFARANKKVIARRRTDRSLYLPEADPVSVFMAGSPGAGKTEASVELLAKVDGPAIIRIDPDELRSELPGYTGDNAWLFQAAISVLVDKIHDMALEQEQSFLLDGTLSHYGVAKRNIVRSLGRRRVVQILYVYQDPCLAWEFVRAREAAEGRRILPQHFIDQYFAAREVVNRLKLEYGSAIQVDLLLKNNDNTNRLYRAGIDQIDSHVPEKYNRADIESLLKQG